MQFNNLPKAKQLQIPELEVDPKSNSKARTLTTLYAKS